MDTYEHRKLVAGILIGALAIFGLIWEAMRDKTLRNFGIGCIAMMVIGMFCLIALIWAAFVAP